MTSSRKIVRAALIAAVYVALCMALSPLSYGTVQVRISEALTLLPLLCPEAVVGVTLGCFISNMLAGQPVDMVVGTLATLMAALLTRRLRGVRWRGLPIAGALPPILLNAVIIGAELTWLYFPANSPAGVWAASMLSVGAGQLISCGVLGVAMIWAIERKPALVKLFKNDG